MTNRERAEAAEKALHQFTVNMYGDRAPHELPKADRATAIYDLVTDLLHYARLNRIKPDEIMVNAQRQFDYERKFRWDGETD